MKIIHNRKPNRLKNYDYSQNGLYFVTICTKNRENHFGEIKNGKMILNQYGKIVENQWTGLPNHYPNCILDEYVIMPNHFHGIIIIDNSVIDNSVINNSVINNSVINNSVIIVEDSFKLSSTVTMMTTTMMTTKTECLHGLSEIIRGFKTFSSKNINILYGEKKFQWQRSFYDHIIKNKKSLFYIRKYIQNNPKKYELEKDREHLSNVNI